MILSSHLGRPKGGFETKFSLNSIIPRLSELLGQTVTLVPDCIGMAVAKAVSEMNDGDVVLLENVRFYPEEEANDKGDVNFSFSIAHMCQILPKPLPKMLTST